MSISDAINDGAVMCPQHRVWTAEGESCPWCFRNASKASAPVEKPRRFTSVKGDVVGDFIINPDGTLPVVRAHDELPPGQPPRSDNWTCVRWQHDGVEYFRERQGKTFELLPVGESQRLRDKYDDQSRQLADTRNELDRAKTHLFDPLIGPMGQWVPFQKLAFVEMERADALRAVAKKLGLVEDGEDLVAALTTKLPTRVVPPKPALANNSPADAVAIAGQLARAQAEKAELEAKVEQLERHNARLREEGRQAAR